MGFELPSSSSKAVRLLIAAMFAVCLDLHAAELPVPVDVTNAASTRAGFDPIENSVVKIFATVRYPDPYKPVVKTVAGRHHRQRRGDRRRRKVVKTVNGIRSQGSQDALAIWNAKPSR